MAMDPALLATIGGPVAKFLLRKYLGETAGHLGGPLVDIGSQKIKDYFTRREHTIKFEEMANAIIKRLVQVFSELEGVNAEAVTLEVGRVVEKASLTDLILEVNLSASELERRLLHLHDAKAAAFSDKESAAYRKVLNMLANYLTQIASQLPAYNEALARSTLSRLTHLGAAAKESTRPL